MDEKKYCSNLLKPSKWHPLVQVLVFGYMKTKQNLWLVCLKSNLYCKYGFGSETVQLLFENVTTLMINHLVFIGTKYAKLQFHVDCKFCNSAEWMMVHVAFFLSYKFWISDSQGLSSSVLCSIWDRTITS